MRAYYKYQYNSFFHDFVYKHACRMARVRDELREYPITVTVTFYEEDCGIWYPHHTERGFAYGHEAYERGIEWVEEGR